MTEALFLALGAAAGFLATWREVVRLRLDLAAERTQTHRLTELLMARSAPQEYAAYVNPTTAEDTEEWLFTEDGLHGVPIDTDEL